MELSNVTIQSEFILWWPAHLLQYHGFLFAVTLFVYSLCLIGNMLIITLICLEAHLQTPMYFFLGNLSFLEMCYTSVTVPTILGVFLEKTKHISLVACLTQIYFLHFFGCTECFLLALMAYDRYTAICKPLHYGMMMNRRVCIQLASLCWTSGFLDSLTLTLLTSMLPFCGPFQINNLFCDVPPLLKIACTDTRLNEVILRVAGGLLVVIPLLFILWSYLNIVTTIWKIPSMNAKQKAFSTCSSHLTVVGLFYGTVSYMYMRPNSGISTDWNRLVVLVYTVLTPALNPLIYSLRNNDVIEALNKVLCKIFQCQTLKNNTI
ncbi:olfactory receptor 10C1-like [Ambystoma mexicanum]|uniref:olfactory receptor 10C1-like n=1 Tax=Ambystoma mexicanum TaxID=8296 RepID=UPI0037E8403E